MTRLDKEQRLIFLLSFLIDMKGVESHSSEDLANEFLKYYEGFFACSEHVLNSYSPSTFQKDIQLLKQYGILEKTRRYRWGYYLGTGVMAHQELQVALNILASAAQYQLDPSAQRVHEAVHRRLKGSARYPELSYPVRAQLNPSIIHTDPADLIGQANHKHTLFQKFELLEHAILNGIPLRVCKTRDPYKTTRTGFREIYPLQIVHYSNSWYLINECLDTQLFSVSRIDRLSDDCATIEDAQRSLAQQKIHLDTVHRLLKDGWGINLWKDIEKQKQEISGKLKPTEVKVRFFGNVTTFILEGDRRHHTQHIEVGPKRIDSPHDYVDYSVKLPERSFTRAISS